MLKKITTLVLTLLLSLFCFAQTTTPLKAYDDYTTAWFANLIYFVRPSDVADDQFANPDFIQHVMEVYNGTDALSFTSYFTRLSGGKFKINNVFPLYDEQTKTASSYVLPYTSDQLSSSSNYDAEIIDWLIENRPYTGSENLNSYHAEEEEIDNVTVIIQWPDSDSDSPTLRPHKANYYNPTKTMKGLLVDKYNFLTTGCFDDLNGAGVVVHEFLHTLGLPDLYTQNEETPVGIWDIMASESRYLQWPLAYMISHLCYNTDLIYEWTEGRPIDETTVNEFTKSQRVTLYPVGTDDHPDFYYIQLPGHNEVFVLEYRRKGTAYSTELDQKITDSGLVVYRVNRDVEALSNLYEKTGVYLFRPQTIASDPNYVAQNDARYAFWSKDVGRTQVGSADLLAGLSGGAITYSDDTNTGIIISDIGYAGDTISCMVTLPDTSDAWQTLSGVPDGLTANSIPAVTVNGNVTYLAFSTDSGMTVYKNESTLTSALPQVTTNEIINPQIVICNDTLYVAGKDCSNPTDSYVFVKKYNGKSWDTLNTDFHGNEGMSAFDLYSFNNELYLAYDAFYDMGEIKKNGFGLSKLNGSLFESLGGALFDDADSLLGQLQMFSTDTNLYVQMRLSCKGEQNNLIKTCILEDGSITTMNDSIHAEAFSGIGQSQPWLLARTSDTSWSLYKYQEAAWVNDNHDVTTDANAFCQLISQDGLLYALFTSSGKMQVKVFTGTEWLNVGSVIDTSDASIVLSATDSRLLVAYCLYDSSQVKIKTHATFDPDTPRLTSLTLGGTYKTSYKQYEAADYSGLTVTGHYSDDSDVVIPLQQCHITGFSTDEATDLLTITVAYKDQQASYPISVSTRTLQSISVTHTPNQTSYIQNETVDLTGLEVTAVFDDGEVILSEGEYTITGFTTKYVKNLAGATVTYRNKSYVFGYSVYDSAETQLHIISQPTKTTYHLNEFFDSTGLQIGWLFDNNFTQSISLDRISFSGFNTITSGDDKLLHATYMGKTIDIKYTVTDSALTSISIDQQPTVTSLPINTQPSLDGLQVSAHYADGSSKVLSSDEYSVTEMDTANIGSYTAKVTYQDKTATFDYSVVNKTVTSITIVSQPYITNWPVNNEDSPSLDGLKVSATYNDGTTVVLNDGTYEVDGYVTTQIGSYTATVSYQGQTATFDYVVSEAVIVDIQVTKDPDQCLYYQYEPVSIAGMVVTAIYSDGSTKTIKNYSVDGFESNQINDFSKDANVRYLSFATSFMYAVFQPSNGATFRNKAYTMLPNSSVEAKLNLTTIKANIWGSIYECGAQMVNVQLTSSNNEVVTATYRAAGTYGFNEPNIILTSGKAGTATITAKVTTNENKTYTTSMKVVVHDGYSIKYDLNGGYFEDSDLFLSPAYYKQSLTLPKPTMSGYNFAGWYDGDTKVTSILPTTIGDLNLVAHWNKVTRPTEAPVITSFTNQTGNKLKVSYQKLAGVDNYEIFLFRSDGTFIDYASTTSTSYTFSGLQNNVTYQVMVYGCNLDSVNNAYYGPESEISEATAMKYYYISFDPAGGTLHPSTYNKNYYYKQTVKLYNPTRAGYVFTGWYNGSKKVTSITKKTSGDLVLTAHWSEVTPITEAPVVTSFTNQTGYKLKLSYQKVNGANGYEVELLNGVDVIKTVYTTSTSYTFSGLTNNTVYQAHVRAYKTDSEGTKTYSPYSDDLEKTAVKYYFISFDADGGTLHTKNYGSNTYYKKAITLYNPVKVGYVFTGWYNGSKRVTSISKKTSGDLVLIAHWTPAEPSSSEVTSLKYAKYASMKVSVKASGTRTGFEIQYSVDPSFTLAVKTVKTTSTSYTLKKLTKYAYYYVRVRTYVTDSAGTTTPGEWSAGKSVYISK